MWWTLVIHRWTRPDPTLIWVCRLVNHKPCLWTRILLVRPFSWIDYKWETRLDVIRTDPLCAWVNGATPSECWSWFQVQTHPPKGCFHSLGCICNDATLQLFAWLPQRLPTGKYLPTFQNYLFFSQPLSHLDRWHSCTGFSSLEHVALPWSLASSLSLSSGCDYLHQSHLLSL